MKTKRLFIALWPDALVREKIYTVQKQAIATSGSMRAVRFENLHLTLFFTG